MGRVYRYGQRLTTDAGGDISVTIRTDMKLHIYKILFTKAMRNTSPKVPIPVNIIKKEITFS